MGGQEKLVGYLQAQGVEFSKREHPEVFTAQEVASAEHIPGQLFVKVVIASVDDELAMAPRGRVQDHLDECPDCAAHVRMLLAVRRSLRRATGADPEALRRLQARLADIEPEA